MKLTILSLTCSIMQIVGLVIIIAKEHLPEFSPILLGIAGFAAIVRYLAPIDGFEFDKQVVRPIAALSGLGIIIYSCIL